MLMKQVKTITLEYEDGSIETTQLPTGTGFYRERFTYEEAGDTKKLVNKLECFEVFWAVRTPLNKEG